MGTEGIILAILLVLMALLVVLDLAAAVLYDRKELYLAGAMSVVATGLFQSLYFMLPQSDRCNVILLLPLKLSFLPLWLAFCRWRNLFAVGGIFRKVIYVAGILSSIEIVSYLLPLGVLGFTHEYTRSVLDYLFMIQKYVYTVFSVYSVAFAAMLWFLMKEKSGYSILSVYGVPFSLAAIGFTTGLSVHQNMFGIYSETLYYVPQMISAVLLSVIVSASSVAVFRNGKSETPAVRVSKNNEHILQQTKNLIRENELYLKPDLRISEVAERMSLSQNYLSHAINDASGEGFNDLVNRMRVECVVRKMMDNEHRARTLSGIASDCGFRSKTTFNASFKKIMGVTPSQYVKTALGKGVDVRNSTSSCKE